MANSRLFLVLALWGLAVSAADARPLTLIVDSTQLPQPSPRSPESCLIGTNTCQSLATSPSRPCLVDTKPCPKSGDLIAVSPTLPRK
jgi:hypothetical protein